MKVLHVHDCWPVTGKLVQGLRELGIQAEIFEPTLGGGEKRKLKRALLPLVRTAEAFKLRQVAKQGHYDIIHVHYARHPYLALLAGLPYFLHCHGSDLRLDLHRPIMGWLTRLAIRKAIQVFYVTPVWHVFLKDLRPDAIYLPNPVDLSQFAPAASDRALSSRVLAISKLDAAKGLTTILRI